MTFGVLSLLVLAGLAGPLLASGKRSLVPVVVGEIAAGVVIGRTGFRFVHADQPTVAFLGDVGFVVLMFAAGTHVPLRNAELRQALRPGALTALATFVLAGIGGAAIGSSVGDGHPLVWALLLATGSAAIVLPAIEEAGLSGRSAFVAMVWATFADVVTIVLLPLVLQPSRALHAGLGALAVIAVGGGVLLVAHHVQGRRTVEVIRQRSKERAWALDLRLALLGLFALTWFAHVVRTSPLVAGFAVGIVVAALGGPKRLTRQIAGVANGLFVPLFFVILGARLDLRALFHDRRALLLLAAIVGGNVICHLLAAAGARLPIGVGLVATAQLGVPAAVVTLGLDQRIISPGKGAAIIAAALITLGISAVGSLLLRRTGAAPSAAAPVHEQSVAIRRA